MSETEAVELAKSAPAKSGAIEIRDRGVHLQTLDDAWRFAQYVIKSGLAPKGVTTPEQALIAMQAGAELGFTPMRALAVMTVINGRAGIMGDGALAKIMESGVCSRPPVVTVEGEGDQRRGVVRFQRRNMPEPVEVAFSVADAKRAGLWAKDGPWKLYPDNMLGWRAVARAGKLYFGDVLMGLVVAEELADYPAARLERTAVPPREPDPLLAVIAETPPADVIAAEEVASAAVESEVSDLHARHLGALEDIRKTNTLAGAYRAWKATAELRAEMEQRSPSHLEAITKAYEDHRRELGVKE